MVPQLQNLFQDLGPKVNQDQAQDPDLHHVTPDQHTTVGRHCHQDHAVALIHPDHTAPAVHDQDHIRILPDHHRDLPLQDRLRDHHRYQGGEDRLAFWTAAE